MVSKGSRKWAQYNLGECYELGNGVNKDGIKALELYEKSAEQGYQGAKFRLGYFYLNGIGTEVNEEKGFELYNEAAGKKDNNNKIDIENDGKAVEDDNKVALYNLGKFYELGQGVYKNELVAFEFYKKSGI